MDKHEKIDYLEIPSTNLEASKQFFKQLFNWEFEDYGTEYTAFSNQGIDGGFYKSEQISTTANGSMLPVFYSKNLEETLHKVKDSGGRISQDIFSFPGGRRFQFFDITGNEFGVWSDV